MTSRCSDSLLRRGKCSGGGASGVGTPLKEVCGEAAANSGFHTPFCERSQATAKIVKTSVFSAPSRDCSVPDFLNI